MAIQFPETTNDNEEFESGGITYKYDATSKTWTIISSPGGGGGGGEVIGGIDGGFASSNFPGVTFPIDAGGA